MSEALEPRLKPIDEKVLAALPAGQPGWRALWIARKVYGRRRVTRREHAEFEALVVDVRLILRGFEHLGKATGRGGWWRAL